MKKTVIAVWGQSNNGKSSVIKEFYSLLLKEHSPNIILDGADFYDIQKIVEVNGVRIGIESQGDPDSRIFKSLPLFKKEKCDIIICATRTRGKTLGEVYKLEKSSEKYEAIWFSNLYSWQKDNQKMNEDSAQFLLKVFEQVLSCEY